MGTIGIEEPCNYGYEIAVGGKWIIKETPWAVDKIRYEPMCSNVTKPNPYTVIKISQSYLL